MKKQIVVRRLTPADACLASQAIRTLKSGRRHVEAKALDPNGMARWLANPANVLIVACENHNCVGFALGYLLDRIDEPRPMVCFYEIVVAPDCRKLGIGRQLVEEMKQVARISHAVKMWVQTTPDNIAAQTLYQSAGGIPCDTPDHVYSWTEEALSHSQTAAL